MKMWNFIVLQVRKVWIGACFVLVAIVGLVGGFALVYAVAPLFR